MTTGSSKFRFVQLLLWRSAWTVNSLTQPVQKWQIIQGARICQCILFVILPGFDDLSFHYFFAMFWAFSISLLHVTITIDSSSNRLKKPCFISTSYGHEHLKTPLGPLKNGWFSRTTSPPRAFGLRGLRLASSLRIKTGGLDDLLLNRSWELCCTSTGRKR